jgi:hypothetical protein
MKANMKFTPEYWNKLTPIQKSHHQSAKGLLSLPKTPYTTCTTCAVHVADAIQPPVATSSDDTSQPAGSHLCQTLSDQNDRTNNETQITVNGDTYQCIVNKAHVTYSICSTSISSNHGSLIDGGTDCELSGDDVCVLELTLKTANVLGLDAHLVSDIPLATIVCVIHSTQGNSIGIFYHYAHLGTGKTVNSSTQLCHFGSEICDIHLSLNGKQHIHHTD